MSKRFNIAICMILATAMLATMGIASPDAVYAFTGSNPYGSSGYSSYTHNDRYSTNIIANGVDVSEYQGSNTDWKQAKQSGVDYAILRVTWTGYGANAFNYGKNDKRFEANLKKAKAAGIMVGAYVFSQATTTSEAVQEAKAAIARIKALGYGPEDFDLPIYMDYEYAGLSNSKSSEYGRLYKIKGKSATAIKCANAFCETIRAAGYEAGVYANTSFFSSMLTNDSVALDEDIDLWCAQYYSKNQSSKKYTKWQFSSSAKIRDIFSYGTSKLSSTDVNFWYLDPDSQIVGPTDSEEAEEPVVAHGQNTYNYTGSAVEAELEIRQGDKLLKEGTDYTIGYINNVYKGDKQAYAYVRGIGDYSGYMLIPYTIGSGYFNNIGLAACKLASESGYIFKQIFGEADATQAQDQSETAGNTEIADESEHSELVDNEDIDEADETAELTAGSIETGTYAELTRQNQVDDASTEASGEDERSDETTDKLAENEDAAAELQETDEGEEVCFGISNKLITGIPSGMTVAEFLGRLAWVSEDYEGCALRVIDNKGNAVDSSTELITGMLLAVYDSADKLIGTAVITVDDSYISDVNGNKPVNASIKMSLGTTTYYYNGTAKKPTVTVTWNGKTVMSSKTASTSYIKLSYASGRKKPGTYKVSASGIAYPGSTSASFTIAIKPTSISSLTSGTKAFTVKVNKLASSNVSGYRLRYSRSSDMSDAKIVTIGTKYKTVSKKVSKLETGTTYYVQVQAYKKISGKKYYSSWSAVKAVTTR